MDAPEVPARLGVVGVNHRSSTAALRDALFVPEGELRGFLAELRRNGISQALLMSTCDRVELQFASPDPGSAGSAILAALGRRAGHEVVSQAYVHHDGAALRHIFSVACSLDSQVVGEPQVLGQVKSALALSREMGLVGAELEGALEHAFAAAKRVRSETAIGERPVSLAAAAASIARDVHGDPARCAALVLGLGEMGELLVEHFHRAGLSRISVSAPSAARAAGLARRFDAHVIAYDALETALAQADIVITAMGTGRTTISAEQADAALRARRRRPMLFLDLGVPDDVAREIEKLDGAFRYGIEDLEALALKGRAQREAATGEAWAIVDAELAAYERQRAGRKADGAIVRLRRHFEAERLRALGETGGDAERATELLVQRLLHGPSAYMRAIAQEDPAERARVEGLIARAFGLDDTEKDK
ncbi:MAG: glutamyl-tRNA reductase [Alphaproteobacteria bacterium]|nr:glutamyl-tRNA reductase [Alphaproteobacteria bacterium]